MVAAVFRADACFLGVSVASNEFACTKKGGMPALKRVGCLHQKGRDFLNENSE
jgi:hypothetical protein